MSARMAGWALGAVVLAGVVAAVVFAVYCAFVVLRNRLPASAEAKHALQSDGHVSVAHFHWGIAFVPAAMDKRAGLVYFQGALVDAVAYAPLCRSIAQQTPAIVCLIQSPLRLSFFCGLKRARAAMADFEGVDVWNLGGHSLGGTTACNLVAETKAEKKIGASGVCMHAAYSLLDVCTVPGLRSLQVLAELDGIVSSDKLHDNAKFLPDDIKVVVVAGGNHSGFGYYGPQTFPKVDGQRSISLAEQQAAVIDHTVSWIREGLADPPRIVTPPPSGDVRRRRK